MKGPGADSTNWPFWKNQKTSIDVVDFILKETVAGI